MPKSNVKPAKANVRNTKQKRKQSLIAKGEKIKIMKRRFRTTDLRALTATRENFPLRHRTEVFPKAYSHWKDNS